MIMDSFLNNIAQNISTLKHKNRDTMNQFKIQLYQISKKVHAEMIRTQFEIDQQDQFVHEGKEENKNQSTKCYQGWQSKDSQNTNIGASSHIQKNKLHDPKRSILSIYDCDKQNQNPNVAHNCNYLKTKTDISIIEEFPVKSSRIQKKDFQEHFNENGKRNEQQDSESMKINTVQVRQKYQKFISPSAGWTISETRPDENKHINEQSHPFCTQFAHEGQSVHFQSQNQFQNIRQDQSLILEESQEISRSD